VFLGLDELLSLTAGDSVGFVCEAACANLKKFAEHNVASLVRVSWIEDGRRCGLSHGAWTFESKDLDKLKQVIDDGSGHKVQGNGVHIAHTGTYKVSASVQAATAYELLMKVNDVTVTSVSCYSEEPGDGLMLTELANLRTGDLISFAGKGSLFNGLVSRPFNKHGFSIVAMHAL